MANLIQKPLAWAVYAASSVVDWSIRHHAQRHTKWKTPKHVKPRPNLEGCDYCGNKVTEWHVVRLGRREILAVCPECRDELVSHGGVLVGTVR